MTEEEKKAKDAEYARKRRMRCKQDPAWVEMEKERSRVIHYFYVYYKLYLKLTLIQSV